MVELSDRVRALSPERMSILFYRLRQHSLSARPAAAPPEQDDDTVPVFENLSDEEVTTALTSMLAASGDAMSGVDQLIAAPGTDLDLAVDVFDLSDSEIAARLIQLLEKQE